MPAGPAQGRQIHCVFMTIQLRFCDTAQTPAVRCASWPLPVKAVALRRVVLRPAMAPAPQQNSSVAALAGGLAAIGIWRLMAVAAPHLGALILMLRTETDFGSRLCFLLTWGILNFLFIALLRRPALSGALSLTVLRNVAGLLPLPRS